MTPDHYEDFPLERSEEDEELTATSFSSESDFDVEDEYVKAYANFMPFNSEFTSDEPTLYAIGQVDRNTTQSLAQLGGLLAPVQYLTSEECTHEWSLEFGHLEHTPAFVLVTPKGAHLLEGGSLYFRAYAIRRILNGQPR
jgi:hypothetical protein